MTGPGPAELDADGEVLWAAVLAAWDDTGAHDRFIQHCFRTGRLVAAGARYRARLMAAPDDPIAPRMQERIVFLSTQALVPAARGVAGRGTFWQSPWFVAMVLGCAALGALLGFVLGGRP
jgi:hypothetical protein